MRQLIPPLLLLFILSCSAPRPQPSVINPGDRLLFQYITLADTSQEILHVDSAGDISLPVYGKLHVAGMTLEQAGNAVHDCYTPHAMRQFKVSLSEVAGTVLQHAERESRHPTVISDSTNLSIEAKAQLRHIADEYGAMSILVSDHKIVVTIGMLPQERSEAMEDAIHKVVGNDFKISETVK